MSRDYLLGDPEYARNFRGRIFGKRRAVVRDILDPNQHGRVKVYCPSVYGEDLSPWAMPSFPMAGRPDSGSMWIPAVGSTVWIEFEEGLPAHPIYVGGFYTDNPIGRPSDGSPYEESDAYQQDRNSAPRHFRGLTDGSDYGGSSRGSDGVPESNFKGEYPHVRGYRTPGGHRIEMDDTPGAERVLIEHAKGGHVEILSDGTIHVIADGNLVIKSSSESSTVEKDRTKKIGGNEKTEVSTNSEKSIGGKYRVVAGKDRFIQIGSSSTDTTAGDSKYEVGGSVYWEVMNHWDLITSGSISFGSQSDFFLSCGGSGRFLFSNTLNSGGPGKEALLMQALNGTASFLSSDPTGSLSRIGVMAQALGSTTLTPTPIVGDEGPVLKLGNMDGSAEPAVKGDQLVGLINALLDFLGVWLTDYIAHAHPPTAPSYTSAAIGVTLNTLMQTMKAQYVLPTSPKLRPAILSDLVEILE